MSPARDREPAADFDAILTISFIDLPLGIVRHTCNDANICASLNQILRQRSGVDRDPGWLGRIVQADETHTHGLATAEIGLMIKEPRVGVLQSFGQADGSTPAKGLQQADVQQLARSAVGFAAIKFNAAAKA